MNQPQKRNLRSLVGQSVSIQWQGEDPLGLGQISASYKILEIDSPMILLEAIAGKLAGSQIYWVQLGSIKRIKISTSRLTPFTHD